MKVAVKCESPLLQRSLELFLEKYLSPLKNCDIVVSDQRIEVDQKLIYVSTSSDADLVRPFSKSQLVLALEKAIKNEKEGQKILSIVDDMESIVEPINSEEKLDFKYLQERIEKLTKEYQDNILKTVRAFYER